MSNSRFKDYLRAADQEWAARAVYDYFLLYAAALLVLTSGLLMALGGHHAGFHNWQAAAHSVLTPWFWANITFVGDTLTALAIALLVALRFPKVALVTLLAAVIGGVTIQLIKYGLALPRPPAVLSPEDFTLIGPGIKSRSFPSGHTATAFLMMGVFTRAATQPIAKIVLIVIALLIGVSRVAVGVHWPVDVMVGGAIGCIGAFLALQWGDRLAQPASVFGAIMLLMVVAAAQLLFYDGGFEATRVTAPIIGATSLLIAAYVSLRRWQAAAVRVDSSD